MYTFYPFLKGHSFDKISHIAMILPFDKKVSHISAQDITRYDITKDREAVQLLQLLQVIPDLIPDLITSVFKHQRINECFHWFGLTGHKHKRKSKLGSHFISKHCPNTKPFSRLITLHSNIK